MVQAIRLIPSAAMAVAVTFGLVFIMQYLIDTGQSAMTAEPPRALLKFVRVKQEEIVETQRRKPEKLPEPEAPPPKAPLPPLDSTVASINISNSGPGTTAVDGAIAGPLGYGSADGEYLPIVKVAPIYPRRALQRGLEGDVIVEFTVTRRGTVTDVVVIESTGTVFNQAAIAAAEKFKYKPRVVNGQPIEVPGVKNRIAFRLED